MNTNNYPFKNLSDNLKKNSVTYKEFEYNSSVVDVSATKAVMKNHQKHVSH